MSSEVTTSPTSSRTLRLEAPRSFLHTPEKDSKCKTSFFYWFRASVRMNTTVFGEDTETVDTQSLPMSTSSV